MIARCSVAGFLVLAMVVGSHLAPAKDRTAEAPKPEAPTPTPAEAELTALQLSNLRAERLEAERCIAVLDAKIALLSARSE